jgi:Uma2 family endonuclease
VKILTDDIYVELKGQISDKLSEKAFYKLCVRNELARLERDGNGEIIIRPLIGVIYSNMNAEICGELGLWNKIHKKGVAFNSSVGFTLKDSSMLSPSGAWMKHKTWNGISKDEKQKFAKVCPEFIYELITPSDNLKYTQQKMLKWMENGCELAWLIIPEKQEAHIYRSNGSIEILQGFDKKLSGENVLPGFALDLNLLK